MELEVYRRYSQMARGLEKAELVFKNGRVFSSGTGEFIEGDVAVADGIVIGVGTYEGETEIDLDGKVICPGFIDSHLHLESTLVTPGELVRQAAQCGTTTFIVDPHESANVSGTDGIDYILDQTEDAPANVYVMMPSCVPATHVDDNGCLLTAGRMKAYLDHPRRSTGSLWLKIFVILCLLKRFWLKCFARMEADIFFRLPILLIGIPLQITFSTSEGVIRSAVHTLSPPFSSSSCWL